MLAQQSRLLPLRANVLHPQRSAGDQREGERGSKNLPAPFAFRSIDRHHVRHPFTTTSCFSVWTTSTRSLCAAITASIDLYAAGVSSITSSSLRHSIPSVAFTWSSSVKRRFASVRDIARPAP